MLTPFLAECADSKECAPAKHHYDECVERVTGQIDNEGKAKEDCIEECKLWIPSNRRWLALTCNQSSTSLTAQLNVPPPSSSLSSSKSTLRLGSSDPPQYRIPTAEGGCGRYLHGTTI